jgi:hypothetical protein
MDFRENFLAAKFPRISIILNLFPLLCRSLSKRLHSALDSYPRGVSSGVTNR